MWGGVRLGGSEQAVFNEEGSETLFGFTRRLFEMISQRAAEEMEVPLSLVKKC